MVLAVLGQQQIDLHTCMSQMAALTAIVDSAVEYSKGVLSVLVNYTVMWHSGRVACARADHEPLPVQAASCETAVPCNMLAMQVPAWGVASAYRRTGRWCWGNQHWTYDLVMSPVPLMAQVWHVLSTLHHNQVPSSNLHSAWSFSRPPVAGHTAASMIGLLLGPMRSFINTHCSCTVNARKHARTHALCMVLHTNPALC